MNELSTIYDSISSYGNVLRTSIPFKLATSLKLSFSFSVTRSIPDILFESQFEREIG